MSNAPRQNDAQLPCIANAEQALLYLNAQNLVSRWNNNIIHAKTGTEQLATMRASGVFADDVHVVFDFGEQKYELNNLTEPEDFYNSFVNPAKKKRYNIASNVDVLEYGANTLRFRFKHWIFFDETLSLVGDNECTMVREGDRCYIASAYIRAIYANTQHAY